MENKRLLFIVILFTILKNGALAFNSIISLIDFEKKPSFDYYDKYLTKNNYVVLGDTVDSQGKPKFLRYYSFRQNGHTRYDIDINFTPKSRHIESIFIYGGSLSEDSVSEVAFKRDLLAFYTDVINKYGLPDSSDDEGEELKSEKDTAKIRQVFEQHTSVEIRWHLKDYYISMDIYESHFKFNIDYNKAQELSRKEYEMIEAEEKAIEEKQKMINTSIIIVLVVIVGIFLIYIFRIIKKEQDKNEEWQKAYKKARDERRAKKQQEVDSKRDGFIKELINKYGAITRVISVIHNDSDSIKHYDDIIVFEKPKKIIFGMKEYDFSDILSCAIYDENRNDIPPTQVTRTKTGSLLGRAAIGGLTLGVAGAVVGALTAKTESTSDVSSPHISSYVIKIGIKSIESPTMILKYGSNKAKAEEVYALMQAIIAMQ
jgi:hypothetical protein